MVPGHEIAGIVAAVGSDVTTFAVGDRVGVGCFVDSCGECDFCRRGEEQFCRKGVVVVFNSIGYDGNLTYGGYSQKIVVKDKFVVRIPDSLGLDVASPLLCAEVTVLSQSMNKKDEALAFGADHYYVTTDPATFTELAGQFDLILNTVSANINVDAFLSTLNVDGALVNLGLPNKPDQYNVFSLFAGRRSITASNVGGIKETQEMLDFSAEHGIAPMIEVIRADQVDEAYERVLSSDVRYRFVIDMSTL